MLNVLVMTMKTLFYSLASYGNTAPPRQPLPGGGPPPGPTVGLREEELRLASRAIRCGVPCLRLSTAHLSRSLTERDIGVYDSFAEMFPVLNVCFHPGFLKPLLSEPARASGPRPETFSHIFSLRSLHSALDIHHATNLLVF